MSEYPSRIVCLTEETTETSISSVRGGSRCRSLRLYGASAGGAAEAEGVGVHQREVRQDRSAAAGSRARRFRSAGRSRRRAREARHPGRRVQSAQRRRDPADDPRMLGGLVGCQDAAEQLADRLAADLDRIREAASTAFPRPRTFFEEWDDPLISGIRWVEELVEIAGGTPIFPELTAAGLARDRIVDPAEVARRDPEVIFASWCGKKMKKATIVGRAGLGEGRARCATTASTKSSRPTSCSPAPRASPTASASCTRCSRRSTQRTLSTQRRVDQSRIAARYTAGIIRRSLRRSNSSLTARRPSSPRSIEYSFTASRCACYTTSRSSPARARGRTAGSRRDARTRTPRCAAGRD